MMKRASALANVTALAMMITTVQPANASAADVSEAAETAAAFVEVTGTGDVVTSIAADADSAAISPKRRWKRWMFHRTQVAKSRSEW